MIRQVATAFSLIALVLISNGRAQVSGPTPTYADIDYAPPDVGGALRTTRLPRSHSRGSVGCCPPRCPVTASTRYSGYREPAGACRTTW